MASQPDPAARVERRRAAAALATGDGEGQVGPGARAVLASVLVAVLGVGGLAAWAQLAGDAPGGTWRDHDVLVVEQETGTRFVWQDGVLHPVPNFVSAQIILGQRALRIVSVPRSELASAPHGARLGLVDAPESLPPAGELLTGPWSVCSIGAGPVRLMLLVGSVPAGGEPLGERALLVREPDGAQHLIWRERRHRLDDPRLTLPALGWVGRSPVPVAPAMLGALPTGATVAPPDLAGVGGPGAAPGLGEAELPALAEPTGPAVCVVVGRDGVTSVLLNPVLPPVTSAVPAGGDGAADLVVVPPGGGALVRDGPGVSVVSALGRRHPVGAPVRELLGYDQVAPVELPAAVVALVPAGAHLDLAAVIHR